MRPIPLFLQPTLYTRTIVVGDYIVVLDDIAGFGVDSSIGIIFLRMWLSCGLRVQG